MAGPLGKKVAIPDTFSPEILFPISREDQRSGKDLIFQGGIDTVSYTHLTLPTTTIV